MMFHSFGVGIEAQGKEKEKKGKEDVLRLPLSFFLCGGKKKKRG